MPVATPAWQPRGRGSRRRTPFVGLSRTRLTLVLLTSAGVSLALMQTLVIPALPFFGREFGASPSWTAWIVTGFLLSSSVSTPIVGKLGDAHARHSASAAASGWCSAA